MCVCVCVHTCRYKYFTLTDLFHVFHLFHFIFYLVRYVQKSQISPKYLVYLKVWSCCSPVLRGPEAKYPKGRAESCLITILSKFEFLKAKTMISKDFLKHLSRIINKSLLKQNSHDIFWHLIIFKVWNNVVCYVDN